MGSDKGVFSGSRGWQELEALVQSHRGAGVFILTDQNTALHCLPLLRSKCRNTENAGLLELPSGEGVKTIETVTGIWKFLGDSLALRSSLLLCLGGGVITDMGGFAAASFKRGMHFAHIPTTLLAMVDASIGGKNGIDVDGLKNQVGLFALPDAVFCFPEFLATLPEREIASGFAEMIKHALIHSRDHFNELLKLKELSAAGLEPLLASSSGIKADIVKADPTETGLRKVLNLGHTVGHAIETWSLNNDLSPLIHGEAIAVGLICEAFISSRLTGLPEEDLQLISGLVYRYFPRYILKPESFGELLSLMLNDKKNHTSGRINFSLLKSVGEAVVDQYPHEDLILESLHYYLKGA